jgi:NADH dehydrogenase
MRLAHPAKDQGKKIVIIIGAGFAGLNAAKTLANKDDVHVLLIDQKNHHLFQPLLYQVATAGLNAADIAVPIRAQFSSKQNIEVHWGRASEINLKEKYVTLDGSEELEFDFLILCAGAQHSYFDHPEWEEFAPGLKTLEQATEMRRRILSAYEVAENESSLEKQKTLLTFIIVGGGPTGVELAGAIADISRTVLINDFKRVDPKLTKVILIESGPRLVASFDEKLSQRTKEDLEKLGVEVRLSTRVDEINAKGVKTGTQFTEAKNVFWAAGVQASKISIIPEVLKDRAGRIKVKNDLSIPEFSNCFVIGDMAAVELESGKFVPGLAPAALQEGKHASKMILATLMQKERQNFKYLDKGQMATIGKHRAIVQFGPFKFGGYFAWIAWFYVHIFYLVGFKNRLAVMINWAWNYLFSKRGSRLITDKDWRLKN